MHYDVVIVGTWAKQGNDRRSFLEVLRYFRKRETDLDFGGDDFPGSDGPDFIRARQG